MGPTCALGQLIRIQDSFHLAHLLIRPYIKESCLISWHFYFQEVHITVLILFNSVFLFAAFLNFATLQLFFNLYRALPASLSPMVRLLFWPLEISSLKQLPAAYIIVSKSFLLFICSVNLPPQSPHRYQHFMLKRSPQLNNIYYLLFIYLFNNTRSYSIAE